MKQGIHKCFIKQYLVNFFCANDESSARMNKFFLQY